MVKEAEDNGRSTSGMRGEGEESATTDANGFVVVVRPIEIDSTH